MLKKSVLFIVHSSNNSLGIHSAKAFLAAVHHLSKFSDKNISPPAWNNSASRQAAHHTDGQSSLGEQAEQVASFIDACQLGTHLAELQLLVVVSSSHSLLASGGIYQEWEVNLK